VFCNRGSYYEFMDLDDYNAWKEDRTVRPRLRLLSEVEAGREYALVCTSFHGGVLVRYVLGDSLKVVSLSDPGAGLLLPQWAFSTRIDDTIDIAGFTRLTEKLIWSAIEASSIRYVDWVVAKEYRGENPILHLYIETSGECPAPGHVQELVHEQLKRLDQPYTDLEEMAGIKPLVVTLLSRGTFARFLQERQAAGIDLAHSKPPHMNPSEETVEKLVAMSALKI